MNNCSQDHLSRGARAKPIPDCRRVAEGLFQSREHGAADSLLLGAEMILKKLMPGDVTSVNARNGMVHQQLRVF